jgi:hypothetical protein
MYGIIPIYDALAPANAGLRPHTTTRRTCAWLTAVIQRRARHDARENQCVHTLLGAAALEPEDEYLPRTRHSFRPEECLAPVGVPSCHQITLSLARRCPLNESKPPQGCLKLWGPNAQKKHTPTPPRGQGSLARILYPPPTVQTPRDPCANATTDAGTVRDPGTVMELLTPRGGPRYAEPVCHTDPPAPPSIVRYGGRPGQRRGWQQRQPAQSKRAASQRPAASQSRFRGFLLSTRLVSMRVVCSASHHGDSARETGVSKACIHEGASSHDPTHATQDASCVAFAS